MCWVCSYRFGSELENVHEPGRGSRWESRGELGVVELRLRVETGWY